MKLAHLSDPHLLNWSASKWRNFLNKRLTGAVNFRFKRRRAHQSRVFEALLDDISTQHVDHLAITGDISTLAFRAELHDAALMLEKHGFNGETVSIVPGNHDTYTRRSWTKHLTLAELGAYATSDRHRGMPGYPFVRLRGPLALIGLSSAVARPVFMANGLVGRPQIRVLVKLLGDPVVRQHYPIILVHHPLIPYASWVKEVQSGLLDRHRVLEALERGLDGRDAIILSGHWHERVHETLGRDGRIQQFVAPSGSHLGGPLNRLAGYHMFEFDGFTDPSALTPKVSFRAFDPRIDSIVDIPVMD